MVVKFDKKKFRKELMAQGYSGCEDFAIKLKALNPKASRQIVYQWINGEQEPSFRYLQHICKVLKVNLSYFAM